MLPKQEIVSAMDMDTTWLVSPDTMYVHSKLRTVPQAKERSCFKSTASETTHMAVPMPPVSVKWPGMGRSATGAPSWLVPFVAAGIG